MSVEIFEFDELEEPENASVTPEGRGAYLQGFMDGRADAAFGQFDASAYWYMLSEKTNTMNDASWHHNADLAEIQSRGYRDAKYPPTPDS